jgi:hypothetical protein
MWPSVLFLSAPLPERSKTVGPICAPSLAASIGAASRAGFGREFDEPIAAPNGPIPFGLRQRRQMRFELRRPLATGPIQKRIHGLS